MSKTRKVRRARKALERAEEARAMAEATSTMMSEANDRIRNNWDLVVEHLGAVLGNDTVLNALIHGPKHYDSPRDRLQVSEDCRNKRLSPGMGADIAMLEPMRIHEVTDLVVQHKESLNRHCMVVRHHNDEASLMLTREALFSTPRPILLKKVAEDLVDHIRKVQCDY